MKSTNMTFRLLLSLLNKYLTIRSYYYQKRFILMARVYGTDLVIGHHTKFIVPVAINGQGSISIGNYNFFGFHLAPRIGTGEILIQARSEESKIEIGNNIASSNNISIVSMKHIKIGDCCLIGDLVTIMDCDFHEIDPVTRHKLPGVSIPVFIGENVWIGSRVIIQKGANIGNNSIITPMSVVTSQIPPDCIAGGIPAKPIKSIER